MQSLEFLSTDHNLPPNHHQSFAFTLEMSSIVFESIVRGFERAAKRPLSRTATCLLVRFPLTNIHRWVTRAARPFIAEGPNKPQQSAATLPGVHAQRREPISLASFAWRPSAADASNPDFKRGALSAVRSHSLCFSRASSLPAPGQYVPANSTFTMFLAPSLRCRKGI